MLALDPRLPSVPWGTYGAQSAEARIDLERTDAMSDFGQQPQRMIRHTDEGSPTSTRKGHNADEDRQPPKLRANSMEARGLR
jgi:hypothetical protein